MRIPKRAYQEALDLLQEECAEVIQAVSKVRRTGPSFKPFNGDKSNLELLKEEVQDVLVILELLEMIAISPEHRETKIEKLKKWSTIFSKEVDIRMIF